MAKTYTVRSVIICDDVRKENNGKEILIGVYNEAVVVPTIPFVLPTFCVRFSLKVEKEYFNFIQAQIRDPNERVVADVSGTLKIDNIKANASSSMRFAPLTIPTAGQYSIYFALEGPLQKVGEFEVWLRGQALPS